MTHFEGLDENFTFLILEVDYQVRATRDFLDSPTKAGFTKIIARDDHIDNLKTIIENKCYSRIHADKDISTEQVQKIRAIQVSSVNLERIGDYFVNIAKQMQYLEQREYLDRYPLGPMFDTILSALEGIIKAYRKESMARALEICKSEPALDVMYKEAFTRIMCELGNGGPAQSLITLLFIIRYFERAGDALLNIGEAIIFSIIGERIKIRQFDALQQTLDKSGFRGTFDDIDFKAIWGSRSGCRIGTVAEKNASENFGASKHGGLYKEGSIDKIRRERDNLLRWQQTLPGLVPDIFGYHENGESGSLLMEFLRGCTLDEMILLADQNLLRNALFVLENTLQETWTITHTPVPAQMNYIQQIQDRLPAIMQVHPEFWRTPQSVGSAEVRSCDELLRQSAEAEQELHSPFTVFIHGDFNCNNIVYNHEFEKIHYIDVYRSTDADYVQDISVFLVSNFRMPVFEPDHRKRINSVIRRFYNFAHAFAIKHGDNLFQARLTFALARSFYTSTRFEMNSQFARAMFNRAVFLLEKLCVYHGKPWEDFVLPVDVLTY